MTDGPFSGRRVLVIEDEMMVAMLLKDILANLGFTSSALPPGSSTRWP